MAQAHGVVGRDHQPDADFAYLERYFHALCWGAPAVLVVALFAIFLIAGTALFVRNERNR